MEIINELKKIASENSNEYLEGEKSAGKKIIGHLCSYMPEEVVHAAGMVPYRLRAVESEGTTKGDIYYSSLNCTYVRHTFDKAMRGRFDFLDGMVFVNGCDHTRRMYDNWRHAELPPGFIHMFIAPHTIDELSINRMTEEIRGLASALEEHFGITITDEALRHSIDLYNKKRGLIAKLYEMRKGKDVPLKGSEVFAAVMASTVLPVETAIEKLQQLVEVCEGRSTAGGDAIRILIASGCMEEIDHLETIEAAGGLIVADMMCMGTRYYDGMTDSEGDPYGALAGRYLTHVSCPRMMNDFRRRIEELHKTRREYNVGAVIVEKLKFCDLWGGEMYLYRQEAKKHGFPILPLERELYGGTEGQIKTRLQAFFEQIKNRESTDDDLQRFSGENYRV